MGDAGAGQHIASGPECPVSTTVMEENWDDEILESHNDMSPFGNY